MSEKGLLSKSIANNISEAIIDKLGGTGYAPTEWSKNINILGIASADIEEALASITEDTSSSDKGLLSLSIASDMGAMLNKKYNTSRGFKPCEVSSAVSMLSPLPEKTASSASIASFSDGADDVPTKSLVVTISPTLDGKSEVTETQTGKNLIDIDNFVQRSGYNNLSVSVSNNVLTLSGYDAGGRFGCFNIPTKIGVSYTVKYTARTNVQNVRAVESETEPTNWINGGSAVGVNSAYTYTASKPWVQVWVEMTADNATVTDLQLEVGSSASTFEPYEPPTKYTASLGRTIYGGTADIVNGEGKDGYVKPVITSSMVNTAALESQNRIWRVLLTTSVYDGNFTYQVGVCNLLTFVTSYNAVATTDMSIAFNINTGKQILIHNSNLTTADEVKAFIDTLDIVYPLSTQTDFTFTGQEVPTRLGYNAFWSDCGDTEVTYRADLDLYEAPSMLLGANNTETEENEEQEENE